LVCLHHPSEYELNLSYCWESWVGRGVISVIEQGARSCKQAIFSKFFSCEF